MADENDEKKSSSSESSSGLSTGKKFKGNTIVKRDFHVFQPKSKTRGINVKLKEGDDAAEKVPPKFLPGLKTEGVI